MKKILTAAAIACAASAPAFSSTVYSENFNDFSSFSTSLISTDSYTDYTNSADAFGMRQTHGFSLYGAVWYITNDAHTDGTMLLNETDGGGRADTTITGLVAGNQYTLSFDVYGDGAPMGHQFGLNVLLDGSNILYYTDYARGQGYYANLGAPRVSVDFVATGSSADLSFVQASPGGSWASPVIDNIVIQDTVAVPEPASAALVLAGLGGMGWLRRRRQG